MRRAWTGIVAGLAFLLALVAVGYATSAMRKPDPVVEPLGVCVVTDPYAFGTDGGGPYAAVRAVTAPVRRGGVISCPEGQFVTVQAQ